MSEPAPDVLWMIPAHDKEGRMFYHLYESESGARGCGKGDPVPFIRLSKAVETVQAALLPPHFQWGGAAMECFNLGKERGAEDLLMKMKES